MKFVCTSRLHQSGLFFMLLSMRINMNKAFKDERNFVWIKNYMKNNNNTKNLAFRNDKAFCTRKAEKRLHELYSTGGVRKGVSNRKQSDFFLIFLMHHHPDVPLHIFVFHIFFVVSATLSSANSISFTLIRHIKYTKGSPALCVMNATVFSLAFLHLT